MASENRHGGIRVVDDATNMIKLGHLKRSVGRLRDEPYRRLEKVPAEGIESNAVHYNEKTHTRHVSQILKILSRKDDA